MKYTDFDEYFDKYLQMFIRHTNWFEYDYSIQNLQRIAERIWPAKVDFLDFDFVKEKVGHRGNEWVIMSRK